MEIIHRIKLDNSDIESAIGLLLQANGVQTEGKTLDIDMTAGRKGTGVYATVTLENRAEALDIEDVKEPEVVSPLLGGTGTVTEASEPVSETTDGDTDNKSLFK